MEAQEVKIVSRFCKSNVRNSGSVYDPHKPEIFMNIGELMENFDKIKNRKTKSEEYFLPKNMR